MSAATKITSAHRQRLAVVYIRQSTMAQVRENTELTARQYALVDEAARLGWDALEFEDDSEPEREARLPLFEDDPAEIDEEDQTGSPVPPKMPRRPSLKRPTMRIFSSELTAVNRQTICSIEGLTWRRS